MNIRYKITVPTRFPLELFEKNQLLYSVGVHFLMLKFPLGFMSPSYRELCMYNRVDLIIENFLLILKQLDWYIMFIICWSKNCQNNAHVNTFKIHAYTRTYSIQTYIHSYVPKKERASNSGFVLETSVMCVCTAIPWARVYIIQVTSRVARWRLTYAVLSGIMLDITISSAKSSSLLLIRRGTICAIRRFLSLRSIEIMSWFLESHLGSTTLARFARVKNSCRPISCAQTRVRWGASATRRVTHRACKNKRILSDRTKEPWRLPTTTWTRPARPSAWPPAQLTRRNS